jgi:hypothetical protein
MPSVADSAGEGTSWTSSSSIFPSKSSAETRKGELASVGDVISSAMGLVVKTALEGDDASAKGGRRNEEDGRVEDIDDLIESARRLAFPVLPLTLMFEVEASGEPPAI